MVPQLTQTFELDVALQLASGTSCKDAIGRLDLG